MYDISVKRLYLNVFCMPNINHLHVSSENTCQKTRNVKHFNKESVVFYVARKQFRSKTHFIVLKKVNFNRI